MIHWLAQAEPTPAPSPRSRLSEIAREFSEGSNIPIEVFYWMFGVLLALLALRYAVIGYRRLRRRTGPIVLYHAIGRDLGINASDRWWLFGIARRAGLASPLTLLMSAATLDHHVERELESAPARRRRQTRNRSERLRAKLFEDAPVPRESLETQ